MPEPKRFNDNRFTQNHKYHTLRTLLAWLKMSGQFQESRHCSALKAGFQSSPVELRVFAVCQPNSLEGSRGWSDWKTQQLNNVLSTLQKQAVSSFHQKTVLLNKNQSVC